MIRHPSSGSTLWVGGYYYETASPYNRYMCVAKTTDEGSTWGFTYLTPDYGIVYALALDPLDPQTLYAGGYHPSGDRAFKSTDGGGSWTNITGTLPNTVDAMAVHPVTTSTVFCGLYNGIYKSTDGGSSWVQKGSSDVNSISIDPVDPSTMYRGGNYVAYASTDVGETWTSITGALSNVYVNDVRAHPVQSGLVYAGTNGAGVYDYWDVSVALTGRVVGGDLRLSWDEVCGSAEYWLYGAHTRAYFEPVVVSPYTFRVAVEPYGTTVCFMPNGIGDPDYNWSYLLVAVNADERELGRSNRWGEHDFDVSTPP
jgi:photosystem II stability/assembly factor-like uncharacterized protein